MSTPATHTLGFALEAMRGRALGPISPRITFAGAATDNRAVRPNNIFFALRGERSDGFDYCGAAVKAGACVVVVSQLRGRPAGCDRVPVIAVPDPRRALGDLARGVRRRFKGTVIGVAGSNGKTTTKELVAAALSSAGKVARTAGNLNTDVGLPLTILETAGDEAFWVLEMAMRGLGEVAYLAQIAAPHVGVITNVGPEHLELLGDLDNVARANGELYSNLLPGGRVVLPADEPRLEAQAAHVPEALKIRFGGPGRSPVLPGAPPIDVRIIEVVPAGPAGSIVRYEVQRVPHIVRLPLTGLHNARNGAAALAAALAAGVPTTPAVAALADTQLPPHRSAAVAVAGRVVLDDCYNANPASMTAALVGLRQSAVGGRAFALLGDMLECGPQAEHMHLALGGEIVRHGIAGLCAVGSLGAHIARGAQEAGLPAACAVTVAEPEEAARKLAAWTRPGDWILVKASRGMRFERAVDELRRVLGGLQ